MSGKLAERIKTKLKNTKDWCEWYRYPAQHEGSVPLTVAEIDTILTAFQFTENMQTLESVDVQIERGDQPDGQWLITVSTDEGEVQFQDRSLMVAVRSAAQAIEGGV